MQRRDLPGFYWDVDRQRYFPLSARTTIWPQGYKAELKTAPNDVRTSQETNEATSLPHGSSKQPISMAHICTRVMRTGLLGFSHMHDIRSRMRADTIASFCRRGPQFFNGISKIISFKVVDFDDTQCILAGDNNAFFSRSSRCKSDPMSQFSRHDTDFHQHLVLDEVSHIVSWGDRVIAIGTGGACNLFITNIATDVDVGSNLRIKKMSDVFSASLLDETLLLGTKNYVQVIDHICSEETAWNRFHCGSDVMAVTQHNNTVLTGCRNGTVQLFDIRDPKGRGTHLLNDRFHRMGKRFIAHLQVIRDWELLVSTSAGDLEMFDLRFSSSETPITTYVGHVNSFRSDLGIDVDPSQEFLFATGEDHVVRGWSLRSGRPLRNPKNGRTDLLRECKLGEAITRLQVTKESDGLRLWAACGNMIRSFTLGIPRDDIFPHGLDDRYEQRIQ